MHRVGRIGYGIGLGHCYWNVHLISRDMNVIEDFIMSTRSCFTLNFGQNIILESYFIEFKTPTFTVYARWKRNVRQVILVSVVWMWSFIPLIRDRINQRAEVNKTKYHLGRCFDYWLSYIEVKSNNTSACFRSYNNILLQKKRN